MVGAAQLTPRRVQSGFHNWHYANWRSPKKINCAAAGPPFLNKYLPFWIVPHIQRLLAVLLAAGVIVYPLFNFAPKLYQWFLQDRVRKLYRRLRIIEEALQKELAASQVVALQTDLENVSRAARILPKRNSDLFFPLRRHIDLTRTELATRLNGIRSQTANVT
jgi:hypothetical protein